MSGSVTSSGLADTTRIHGHPASDTDGKLADAVEHDRVGPQLGPDLGQPVVRDTRRRRRIRPRSAPSPSRAARSSAGGTAAMFPGRTRPNRRRRPPRPRAAATSASAAPRSRALASFAIERLLDDENGADTALPQVISEGDEIVRRPPRAGFGKQCDGRRLVAYRPNPTPGHGASGASWRAAPR